MENNYITTLKSMDTEELVDIYFYRPIGYKWALLFKKKGIHPNTVTIFSIILGVSAGVLFYFKDIYLNVIGMFLLVWANIYDSTDGQLARLTGQKTELGRILDGFAGNLWFITIYVAIVLRLNPTWGVWIWLLACFSGFICHTKQCQLADYYRNIHLYFLRGNKESELVSSLDLQTNFQVISWKRKPLQKVFLFFYINYTSSQEKMTPSFQLFKQLLNRRYENNIPQKIRNIFCAGSRPLMKYTNILTFNTRSFVLFFSLFINLPWIYFLFEISILNIIFFYMRYRHEKLCEFLFSKITDYEK